jgi:hypothetical protein
MARAGLIFPEIGFACRVLASHSCMLGRSAMRSSSRLMKSDKLIPSRAARALSMLWTSSGTCLICTIFDMSKSMQTCDAYVQLPPTDLPLFSFSHVIC